MVQENRGVETGKLKEAFIGLQDSAKAEIGNIHGPFGSHKGQGL